MEKVITKCTKLRDLCLRQVNITDKTLKLIGEHCPDLEDFELNGCDRVTEKGVRNFVRKGSKPLKFDVYIFDSYPKNKDFMNKLKEEYPRLMRMIQKCPMIQTGRSANPCSGSCGSSTCPPGPGPSVTQEERFQTSCPDTQQSCIHWSLESC